MSALICGSFAYDTIMVFEDHFKNHILPDQVHNINVSFLVPGMRREFGGCAGNIAYNLKLLGGDPLPMATVGDDFAPYRAWLHKCGINDRHVTELEGFFTGQAYITTDQDNNQITAFHPGAMNEAHRNQIADAERPAVGIISPDGRDSMIQHAEQFAAAGIPFIFDPGQGLPMFEGEALKRFIDQATWLAMNDYEAELMSDKTGLSRAQMAAQVEALIITKGSEGSVIYNNGETLSIPAVPPTALKDPTGCGDAYRAGLLYGIINELDWRTTGQIASLIGSIKIAHAGTQNHHFSPPEFQDLYSNAFGSSF